MLLLISPTTSAVINTVSMDFNTMHTQVHGEHQGCFAEAVQMKNDRGGFQVEFRTGTSPVRKSWCHNRFLSISLTLLYPGQNCEVYKT